MIDNYINEAIVSSDASYMILTLNNLDVYKVQSHEPITWENREALFNMLLEQVPEEQHDIAKATYDKHCLALKNSELEAELRASQPEVFTQDETI